MRQYAAGWLQVVLGCQQMPLLPVPLGASSQRLLVLRSVLKQSRCIGWRQGV
jgi:hypothetical protein